MAKGRPPKPAALKALAGNPGRRKLTRGDVVEAPDGDFEPPKSLTRTEKKVWAEELPRMRAGGLLKAADFPVFRSYVEALTRYRAAKEVVDRDGMTYVSESKHGSMVRVRPEVGILEKAERMLSKLADQLAAGPKARISTTAQLAASRQYQLPLPGLDGAPPPEPEPATPSEKGPVGWIQ